MSSSGTAPEFAAGNLDRATVIRAIAQPAAFVVVEGEPGVGRTTLLDRLARGAGLETTGSETAGSGIGEQVPVVISARCLRLDRPVPLGPVVEALGTATGRWIAMAARLSPLAGALRPLLPELADVLPPLETGGAARHQTFRALRELLNLADRTVLILDDVHEADEETHDFLRFLAGSPSPRLVVVASSVSRPRRPSSAATNTWWLPRTGVTARIALKPWEAGDIASAAGSRELAELVRGRTGGVADAVVALLDAISGEADTPDALRIAGTVLPATWCETVTSRVADLDARCALVVEAAAVLGRQAGNAALTTVSGVTGNQLTDALMTATDAGLLLERGQGRYSMRSPLVADAAYAGIPGPRRCQLHAGAAVFLSASAEPDAPRIAYHHRDAGDLDEWVRWTAAAVDTATAAGRPGEAVLLLEAALGDSELPRPAKEKFAIRLSREMAFGLVHEHTVRLLRTAVRDWPLSRAARGEIRINLGRLLVNQSGQVDAGRSEIELAAADLSHRRALLALGLVTLALPHVGAVPVEENLRWLDQAEQASKGIRDVEVLAAVTANRVSGRMQVADPGVWQEVSRLPQSPRSAEVRRQVSRTYVNLADAAAWNGHYVTARAYLASARQLICDEHQPYLEALATGTELRLDVAMGVWAEVEIEARHLVDQVGEGSSLAAEPLLALGWHDFGRGRRAAALRNFDSAFAIAAGSAPLQASAFAGRVAVHLAGKDLLAARRLADYGIESVRRKNNWIWAAELMPVAVRVLLAEAQADVAEKLVAEYRRGIDGRDAPVAHAADLFCQGLLVHAGDDTARAAELFERAGQAYHALPSPLAAAGADELAGECFAALGEHQRASAALTAAEATYRSLSLVDAQRCRRALVRNDPSTPRRGRRGYGRALSPRESEVVWLAARNLTNREIAAQLFLSARTVEVHLGRALRKLDLPSRAVLSEELLRACFSGAPKPLTA